MSIAISPDAKFLSPFTEYFRRNPLFKAQHLTKNVWLTPFLSTSNLKADTFFLDTACKVSKADVQIK